MRIRIEITTGYNEYSCWTWTKKDQQEAEEEEKALAQRFIDAEEDDRQEIAYELIEWAKHESGIIPEASFGCIEVSYPDPRHDHLDDEPPSDEKPDVEEYYCPEEVSNDNKSIQDYYEEEWHDPNAEAVVLRDNQMKRGLWIGVVETNKPFNINYLSISKGEISYGIETLEYVDGGEGNYTDYFYRTD